MVKVVCYKARIKLIKYFDKAIPQLAAVQDYFGFEIS